MKKGDYQGAISVFNDCLKNSDYLENHPTNEVKAKVDKGICLYNLQRDIEAKKTLEDITKDVTEQDDINYYKGLAYFYLKKYPESLEFFWSSSHYLRCILIGQTCLEMSEYLEDLRRRIYHGLKVADNINEVMENAEKVIEKIEQNSNNVQNDKDAKNIILSLENLISKTKSLSTKYLEKGIRVLDEKIDERGHQKADKLSELHYNRGVALSNLEKYEKAITDFDEAIGKSDSYALALNNKGNTCVKMENFEDAIEAYTKAIKMSDCKYSIAYNNRGQVYFNLKNYKKALKDFDKAIESNPSNYNAWTNKGAIFFSQKEYGKAKEAFEKALELKPDYALANVYLAKILLYLASSALSYENINKALDFDIRNADAWRLKGQIQLNDKKYEEAVESFDHAFQYSKGDQSLVLWKAYACYLKMLDLEALSSEKKEEKPQVVWSRETKSIDERVADVSKKVINSLPLKSNNSQSSNKSSDKKESEGSKFKNEYYSIIRELEMYSCTCCKGKDISSHFVLDILTDFFCWIKKNLELLYLPIIRYFFIKFNYFSDKCLICIIIYLLIAIFTALFAKLIFAELVINYLLLGSLLISIILVFVVVFLYYYFKSNLQSINLTLENYERESVKSYVLYLLGCLYYKVGDYFEAKNKLEECIKQGPKDIKKSASQLLDHILANYIRSPWWTWWLSSATYRWTKRIIFTFSSFVFIVLLLFHPFVYSILFKFIYLSQFKDFFTEANVTSNMTNNTTTYGSNSSSVISGNDTGMPPNSSVSIPENINETVTESFNSIQSTYSTINKTNEIFMNFDPLPVNNILYYVLVSIPVFILFSPHISKLTFKTTPVEIETKSPKDFEFILHPCLMDDVVRKIDDIPGR